MTTTEREARPVAGGPAPDPARGVWAVTYGMAIVGTVAVAVGRHYGVVADTPFWLFGAVLAVGFTVNHRLDTWSAGHDHSARMHVRVCSHALTTMLVIYLTGWGPALGMCFVLSGLTDLMQSGARTWRAVLGWSFVWCAAGQLLVATGALPTMLPQSQAQILGLLGGVAFTFVIKIAGLTGELKELSDTRLERSELHHRAVVEHAAEGIFTVTVDGTVTSFNAAAESMFGWQSEEIIGRHVETVVADELHDLLTIFLTRIAEGGPEVARHQDLELVGKRRDGSTLPVMVATNAIETDEGPSVCCIIRDLSDRKQFEAQLAYQATHDVLTGLPNRALLVERITHALAMARRHQGMCGVLYLDLDRFKHVNDVLGHAAGDQLLVEAVGRILACVRETDTVARLAGDEFVILCETLESMRNATEIAERVLAALAEPFVLGTDEAHVSGSIGIALSPHGNDSAESLLLHADTAMYRAKSSGRSRFEMFDAAMQRWLSDRVTLERALRQAIPNDELRVYYQPIVATDDGTVRGFEALVRWDRPTVGIVGPNDFIPLAEETGLITEIGAWVLRQACRDAAQWSQRWPDRGIGVAVNVSARQLAVHTFVDVVRETLSETGLDPALLTLELTESTLIEDSDRTPDLLHELRSLGVSLSLDDFGTGYSSLAYLRAFPINAVKIDKSFIRSLGTEQQNTAIVSSVLMLARNLGIHVIAEGIETPGQLAVLVQLGCPYLQGYLFAKPRPVTDIPELVERATSWLDAADEAALVTIEPRPVFFHG